MKTFLSILCAGALLVPAVFGSDAGAEERFRLKHGQYTPQEEACRDCCPRKVRRAQAARDDMGAEARFRTKWGRSSPLAAEPATLAPASTGASARAAAPSNAWAEQWLHAKLGIRSAPAQALVASPATGLAPVNCPHPIDCPEHCC